MICPKCGRPVEENAVICRGCDFILDTNFLGDGILDDEHSLRPGTGGVDAAAFNLADAVILGNIDDEGQSFETSDSGFHMNINNPARLYVSGRSQALMSPDAVPAMALSQEGIRLTPFEKHVLRFIDGKRAVEQIRRAAGLDEAEVKTALATLADKGVVKVVGRALADVDLDAETVPKSPFRRARMRGSLVGAVALVGDDADRAIDDAFRTRIAVVPAKLAERLAGDLPLDDIIAAELLGSPPKLGEFNSSPPKVGEFNSSPPKVGELQTAGARPAFKNSLPSDADVLLALPDTAEVLKQRAGKDPAHTQRPKSDQLAKNQTAGSRPQHLLNGSSSAPLQSADASLLQSEGFDDFAAPSATATAVVARRRESQSSLPSDVRSAVIRNALRPSQQPGGASAGRVGAHDDAGPMAAADDAIARLPLDEIADSRFIARPTSNHSVRPALAPIPQANRLVARASGFESSEDGGAERHVAGTRASVELGESLSEAAMSVAHAELDDFAEEPTAAGVPPVRASAVVAQRVELTGRQRQPASAMVSIPDGDRLPPVDEHSGLHSMRARERGAADDIFANGDGEEPPPDNSASVAIPHVASVKAEPDARRRAAEKRGAGADRESESSLAFTGGLGVDARERDIVPSASESSDSASVDDSSGAFAPVPDAARAPRAAMVPARKPVRAPQPLQSTHASALSDLEATMAPSVVDASSDPSSQQSSDDSVDEVDPASLAFAPAAVAPRSPNTAPVAADPDSSSELVDSALLFRPQARDARRARAAPRLQSEESVSASAPQAMPSSLASSLPASEAFGSSGGATVDPESTVNIDIDDVPRARRPAAPTIVHAGTAGAVAAIPSGFSELGAERLHHGQKPSPENLKKARQLFDEAVRDHQAGRMSAARMNARLAALYDPDNALYAQTLAQWEGGAATGERATDGSAASLSQDAQSELRSLYDDAQDAENRGDFDGALALLRRGIVRYPTAAAFHNRVGVLLAMKKRDFDGAVAAIERAIEIDPDNMHYRSNLGKVMRVREK